MPTPLHRGKAEAFTNSIPPYMKLDCDLGYWQYLPGYQGCGFFGVWAFGFVLSHLLQPQRPGRHIALECLVQVLEAFRVAYLYYGIQPPLQFYPALGVSRLAYGYGSRCASAVMCVVARDNKQAVHLGGVGVSFQDKTFIQSHDVLQGALGPRV